MYPGCLGFQDGSATMESEASVVMNVVSQGLELANAEPHKGTILRLLELYLLHQFILCPPEHFALR